MDQIIYLFFCPLVQICRTRHISAVLQFCVLAQFSTSYVQKKKTKKKMLQPKIHDIFGSFPAVESFQGQFTFSLQLNRTRVNLKVDRDHFAQMVPERPPPHTHLKVIVAQRNHAGAKHTRVPFKWNEHCICESTVVDQIKNAFLVG